MTPKELKKLGRKDLLEMLIELSKENEQLRAENDRIKQQLDDKILTIENSGSLAEASLQLSGVFQAAQAACEQYTQNMQLRSEQMEAYCAKMEAEAERKCVEMVADAKRKIQKYSKTAQRNPQ